YRVTGYYLVMVINTTPTRRHRGSPSRNRIMATVYHGTSLKNVEKIAKRGLVPNKKKNHDESGNFVYVDESRITARAWGRQVGGCDIAVLEIEVPEDMLSRDGQTLSKTSYRAARIPLQFIKGWDIYKYDYLTGEYDYIRNESNPHYK